MARRSPWARQPKKEIRRIRSGFWRFPYSPEMRQAMAFDKRGVEKLSLPEKQEFLGQNKQCFLPAVKATGLNTTKFDRRELEKGHFLKLPLKMQDTLFRAVLLFVWAQENKRLDATMTGHLKKYLAERRIPFDDQAFAVSFKLFVHETKKVTETVNLPRFERIYVQYMKKQRQAEQAEAWWRKYLYSQITGRRRFTKNQFDTIWSWVNRNYDTLQNRKVALLKQHLTNQLDSKEIAEESKKLASQFEEMNKEFVEKCNSELVSSFEEKRSARNGRAEKETRVPEKGGTREKRMEQYVPREKTPRERRQSLESKARVAQSARAKFNQLEYIIEEIGKESPQTADRLSKLSQAGLLKQGTLASLFTAGSLTQKTFIYTLDEARFSEEFGSKQIDAVAKAIAFIGPKGKPVQNAVRAIQSPQKTRIFEFLEKNGIITRHSGGNTVYLARKM